MTDGIIQEVFNSVRKRYIFPLTYDDLDFVEQELIERIKQANTKNPDWDYNFSIGVKLMKIYLIGDNQE